MRIALYQELAAEVAGGSDSQPSVLIGPNPLVH
jgi:hypothetical protein